MPTSILRNWTCPLCKYSQSWDYEQLMKQGHPVCPNDDEDMRYTPLEPDLNR